MTGLSWSATIHWPAPMGMLFGPMLEHWLIGTRLPISVGQVINGKPDMEGRVMTTITAARVVDGGQAMELDLAVNNWEYRRITEGNRG